LGTGHCGRNVNLLFLPAIEPGILGCSAHSLGKEGEQEMMKMVGRRNARLRERMK
jgi:hypothetical protein